MPAMVGYLWLPQPVPHFGTTALIFAGTSDGYHVTRNRSRSRQGRMRSITLPESSSPSSVRKKRSVTSYDIKDAFRMPMRWALGRL
ncbi:hypothetical protein TNCV_3324341 [Trichonephila clavipes]|nr:hypothetical protein TNCV_3324341 [Trichonephila clavipes]